MQSFATYFDSKYAAMGLVMVESLRHHAPGCEVHILCLDDLAQTVVTAELGDNVRTHSLADLYAHLPALKEIMDTRDAWERYAMVKPALLCFLMEVLPSGSWLVFIDADTCFYSDPTPLFQEAEAASIAISAHRFNPITEHLRIYGEFNGGFGFWRKDATGQACLEHWMLQCNAWCHQRVEEDGRFMDQGYLTAWPRLYSDLVQLKHPGQNLAPWNVGSHTLSETNQQVLVDGKPLIFFHFSGLLHGKDGRWRTFYPYEALRQPLVLAGIYAPYLAALDATSNCLQERHGINGLGTVREDSTKLSLFELLPNEPLTPQMIWLPSYPRSGNKLARIILTALFEAKSATVYEQIGEPDKYPPVETWQGPWPELREERVPFSECIFMKTHELPPSDHPAIYIVRDGRDAYVSYAHFVLQHFPGAVQGMSFLDILGMLIRSRDHFGGWSQHVRAWTQRSAKTAVIRFEQMVADPAGSMGAACAWLGISAPPPKGHLPGFEELKTNEPAQFRRGKAGGWRDEMPPEMEELFWSIHGETMQYLGYPR